VRRSTSLAAVGLLALGVAARALFAEPAPQALRVRITSPSGGQTTTRVVSIAGTVAGPAVGRATVVLNGVPMSVAIENGAFTVAQVLSPGANTIRALVEGSGGATATDEVAVHALVPAKDLRITITWDTPGTDVDLWVTTPEAEKVFYGHREGKAGGTLDTDVTTGFGPETFTHARLSTGAYRVQAHAFRIDRPTRVVATIVRGEGTPDEARRTFRGVLLRTGEVLELGDAP
jgi:uncharacterized protein YfaP (DUF2135 family)